MTGHDAPITIRPAVAGDAEGISSVNGRTWLATYPNDELGITAELLRRHLEGSAGEKTAARIARIRRSIEEPAAGGSSGANFVAVSGGAVVGYTHPLITGEGRHRVGALYVLPAFHGRGTGHLLLTRNLGWHGDEQDVYLHVATYNEHAIRFYERHGFVLTGEEARDEVAAIGDVRIPEAEMLRRGVSRW